VLIKIFENTCPDNYGTKDKRKIRKELTKAIPNIWPSLTVMSPFLPACFKENTITEDKANTGFLK
jgi:hypothetical protein